MNTEIAQETETKAGLEVNCFSRFVSETFKNLKTVVMRSKTLIATCLVFHIAGHVFDFGDPAVALGMIGGLVYGRYLDLIDR